MPQPRKSASSSSSSSSPPRRPTALPTTPDDVVANLASVRERLISSLTLTTDRLQETVDDAVRRGRMTRKDAEELLAQLISAGRQQTEALLADLEQLLGRGRTAELRTRAAGSGDAVRRTVGRARRRVGIAGFPILDYDELTAVEITKRLGELTPAELRKVRDHERRHANRKSVLAAIDRKLT
jgi:polyhydroxyalkanoate synthesis regulator phasin